MCSGCHPITCAMYLPACRVEKCAGRACPKPFFLAGCPFFAFAFVFDDLFGNGILPP
eukprot:m.514555 g.514555  ORF g.514555 m.514555 type:complete len:57 (+) comp57452_c0_seq1:1477-1647(+)